MCKCGHRASEHTLSDGCIDYRCGCLSLDVAPGVVLLVLPLPPSVNRVWRSVAGAKKGLVEAVLRYSESRGSWREILSQLYVNVTVSKEGKAFKAEVARHLLEQEHRLLEGELKVEITLYMARKGSDTDNRLKPLLDVLEGVVWENDKQVGEIHVVRRLDRENPRSVILIGPVDPTVNLDPGAEFQYDLAF